MPEGDRPRRGLRLLDPVIVLVDLTLVALVLLLAYLFITHPSS